MKNLLVFAVCAMATSPIVAQETENPFSDAEKPKFATFGFSAGINRSNLSFRAVDRNYENITNGLGYRFGLSSNLRFGNHLSIAPKAELSFNATRIERDDVVYQMNPINLELMGHIKYKFMEGNFSPYVLAGPNIRVPISSNTETFTNRDVALDLGAGIDIPILRFKVSPEIRYSFGIKGAMEETAFKNVKYHNIALALIFSGK